VQKYGENHSLSLQLKQQVEDLISSGDSLKGRLRPTGISEVLHFHAGPEG
jgi:hypothetical protein